jgi:thymidylate synthase (FAD)
MPIIIKQSVSIESCPERQEALELIERIGRTCYKSECQGNPAAFVDMILHQRKHLSVIEHCSATLRFITNRGVTHEMVRHRIAAYSQESTRYCNYSKSKFGSQLTFIEPVWYSNLNPTRQGVWLCAMAEAEQYYMRDLELMGNPQEARDILPNALKTEIVTTYNFRQWLHVFSLRLDKTAHPQMVGLMQMAYELLHERIPEIF